MALQLPGDKCCPPRSPPSDLEVSNLSSSALIFRLPGFFRSFFVQLDCCRMSPPTTVRWLDFLGQAFGWCTFSSLLPRPSCEGGQCCPKEAAESPWALPDFSVALSSGKERPLVQGPHTCKFVTAMFSSRLHLLLRHAPITSGLGYSLCALTGQEILTAQGYSHSLVLVGPVTRDTKNS